MPKKRITMRKLRDVLRLRLHAQLSMRHIRDSLRISLGTIQTIDKKAQELLSRTSRLAYPIRDGIPVMLPEEARDLRSDELEPL